MKLNERFNKDLFLDWVEELLPDFERDVKKVDVPRSFTDVSRIESLGKSSIGVMVFAIQMNSDPTRRRVTITKDSFSILKNYSVQNAIIAYFSPEHGQWRLSLLSSTAVWEGNRVISKLSNLKRQSFVLGENAKIKTPTKYLSGKVEDFNDLKKRFSIEVVNKDFYKEISTAFNSLQSVLHLPSKETKSQTNLEFSVRLIGRIIFCWFLREKKSEAGISLISNNVLSLDAVKNTKDYYHKLLEPLFFEVLNKPLENRNFDEFDKEPFSQTPYLNGGLFSAQYDDFYERNRNDFQSKFHNNLVVPNTWLETFFETLETYHFTIDENTSYDEDLSIDPEMLGRIFENLLAEINPETGESARKSTGSYYTPRVIVDYMVDESLLLYLQNKTEISEDKLRAIISYDLEDDESYTVSHIEKEKIVDALGKVKILDPACGSGAFPIGALQKIVFILQCVDPHAELMYESDIKRTPAEFRKHIQEEFDAGNFDYLRKLRIIRESIYGVDIQPIATEISRLRCFLTLIVDQQIRDEMPDRGIKPLPNLDFKFVTANTLIGLPKNDDGIQQMGIYDNREKIDELKDTIDEYFSSSGIEREHLKTKFATKQKQLLRELEREHSWSNIQKAELSNKLIDWEPFEHRSTDWFDSEWMFGIKEKFDIVIANPPYISFGMRGGQKMTSEERKSIVALYPNSAEYKISIYAIFMDKAIQLSKNDGGIQTLIVPDSFLLGRYFSKIRGNILKHCEIQHISWLPYKIFEATVGYSVVYTFLNKAEIEDNHFITARYIHSNSQIQEKSYDSYQYPQSYFNSQKHNRFRMFFDSKTMSLVTKIESGSSPLGNYFVGRTGVRSLIGQKNIISKEPKGDTWQKGLISGSSIHKYQIAYDGYYINIDPKLLNKGGWDFEVIHEPKILIRQTGDSLTAAIDRGGYYHLNNIHSFSLKNKQTEISLEYVEAILNSKLMTWFYQTVTLERGRTMAQTDIELLETLPIKNIDAYQQRKFETIVEKLSKSQEKDNAIELGKQIDRLVYQIYDLTTEEIKMIED